MGPSSCLLAAYLGLVSQASRPTAMNRTFVRCQTMPYFERLFISKYDKYISIISINSHFFCHVFLPISRRVVSNLMPPGRFSRPAPARPREPAFAALVRQQTLHRCCQSPFIATSLSVYTLFIGLLFESRSRRSNPKVTQMHLYIG